MFLNNVFCGKSQRTIWNIFHVGANLRFQSQMWHCCSPFPPGWEFKKTRAKPLITGLAPSSPVLFLIALWAHAMLCSLLFKSAMLLHAALYLYVTVGPSCVTAPIRVHRFSMKWWPEPVDASEEHSFCFGMEICHFLLCWVQWAYPDSSGSGHSGHVSQGDQRLVLALHYDYTHLEILSLWSNALKARTVSKLPG